MDSPSKLSKLVGSVFPALKSEISSIQDDIRSAENKIKRIPAQLRQEDLGTSLSQCTGHLAEAHHAAVNALKAVHQQYPH